ncbi:MAG TPA: hypothetical protein VGX03_35910 [Candidatus Binatia bacterium]|jgi:hypothetical protein|nr:hypothetical protein [Candidatus Binatia bacterium]
MGIEELIGFLLGVACGGLLRCFRSPVDSQAKSGEPISAQPGEPSQQASVSSVVTAEVVSVQQAVADEPSSTSLTAAEEKKADLKTAILEILRSAEEGLTLSAIAEKMKRHFASIIGPVRLLIEEGLIEKQDRIYKIRGAA